MTTENTEGLSFAEAAAEAMAEEAVAAETSPEPASSEPSQPVVEETIEQPTVETAPAPGLFAPLQDADEDNQKEQPSIAEDSLLVDVDGEQITVAELRQGYMRQSDATQKWQEAADVRKENEKAIVMWEALQRDPAGTIRRLAAKLNAGQPLTENVPNEKSDVSDDIESVVQRAVQQALESDPRIKAWETERAVGHLDSIFDRIQKDFEVTLTEDDKQFVLATADKMGTTDLKFVFSALMYERDQREKEKANARGVSTASGRRTDPSDNVTADPERYDSFKDAFKAVLAEEQAGDLLSV